MYGKNILIEEINKLVSHKLTDFIREKKINLIGEPLPEGSNLKNIDWKIWSKTDKFYVKRFEEETNLISHIFLDTSKSMNFSSNGITKFQYSKIIASALSYLMVKQKDLIICRMLLKQFLPK